ncbi:hypothetical protein PYCCODRAFT_46308 [Trametes coccinea BRFM310]|uniref:Uncharacterized protein n=1 Tax=Trametes coccinea (strain BRFM310) TaxID=1353009 RepID=A0A1Y2J5K5_TRAC3|nr:hypothetical protein PYCCODRAFT_46308 [Trametes coccinea BRFM310]
MLATKRDSRIGLSPSALPVDQATENPFASSSSTYTMPPDCSPLCQLTSLNVSLALLERYPEEDLWAMDPPPYNLSLSAYAAVLHEFPAVGRIHCLPRGDNVQRIIRDTPVQCKAKENLYCRMRTRHPPLPSPLEALTTHLVLPETDTNDQEDSCNSLLFGDGVGCGVSSQFHLTMLDNADPLPKKTTKERHR